MKTKILTLLCICFISVGIAQNDKRLKDIDNDLNKILEYTNAPGFAVAVVEGDKIIYAKGFGYSDYENKIPVNTNTLFAIGSSTKAFTSAILGQLQNEEKLSLSDKPKKYITELEFFNDDMDNHITIKDLMRHSTGIPRHDGAWYFFPSHDKDSLVQRIKFQEPFTGVREQWYYNNFMFLLQGVITERITGESWETNIENRFFKPLGMTRSNTRISEMKSSTNAAFGYELKKGDIINKMDYYDIAGMSPAGSINSSVNDMSKWLMLWINNGKYNSKEILPEAYIKEAQSSQMIVSNGRPDDEFPDIHFSTYGYGWFLQSYKGHYRVDHGGNIDGFSANVAFFPSDSIGIVVLTNQNGSAVPSLVRNTIADKLLNLKETNWANRYKERMDKAKKESEEALKDSKSAKVKNTLPSHIKQDYTGNYSNEGYGKFDIVVENDSLFANLKLQKLYLRHYHYDTFELFEVKDKKVDTSDANNTLRIKFNTNPSGDISNLELPIEPTVDAIVFERTPNSINVDVEQLEKYVGDYELAGTTIKTYIKDRNVLYVFVPGQPEYELVPTAKHKFSFKILDGFKVEFVEDEKGNISDVMFIQPNGTFTAKRKE